MKQYKRKITAITSAILITLTLVGLSADQAVAQGRARKGAKGRAPSGIANPVVRKAGKGAAERARLGSSTRKTGVRMEDVLVTGKVDRRH